MSHSYHISIISDSCSSVPTFVSDRLSASIRLLINQHDCFIGHQLLLLAFKSDTSRFVHVFQRAINNFEILLLASINTYKPEANLTVFFAIKVFRSALKIEFTRCFIGKSYKQHQFNIFQTFQTEIRKKNENLLWTVLHRYLPMILDMIHTLLYKYIYFYTNLCTNTVQRSL